MEMMVKRMGAFLLVVALLLGMTACESAQETTPSTQPTETTAPQPTEDLLQKELTELYTAAIADLSANPVGLEVKYKQKMTVAGHDYSERGVWSLGYWRLGTEEFLARAQRNHVFGASDYGVDFVEIYSDGKMYQTIDKEKFCAEVSAEDFLARLVPVQLLDPELYTLSANEDRTEITFADPIAGESWLMPEDATMTTASGAVVLDAQGKLKESSYTVTYQYGPAELTLEYQATVSAAGREPLVPADTSSYVTIDHPDAIYALEHTYGYLSQVTHLSMLSNDTITSAAAGYVMQNYSDIDAYHVGEEYAAKWTSNFTAMDYSSNQEEKQKLVQKMIDGKYTMAVDDGRETPADSVSQAVMQDAIKATMLESILDNGCVESVTSTNLGGVVLFTYTGTEETGKDFQDTIATALFSDKDLLNNLASSYETKEMQFYVALDGYTALPVAAGIKYEGVHVIQGQECILSQQVDQSFDLPSLSAYYGIFEKTEPEEAPENPATPLFYRVTGANGQQMWLLGTIHVGDNRTAYLPDAIYDALLSSDALAIECNQDDFEAQAEKDEELQKKLTEALYYSDGTTIKDHLVTPELYEDARDLLKATGSYNMNSKYARPSVWASSMESFYMRQGYNLTREKGVEKRLLALVEENNIPVWEVEGTLFQLQMDSKYSEQLQEVLLYSSMGGNTMEYAEGVLELYEKWCAGDEAALTEAIQNEESWELKEEEIVMEGLTEEERQRAEAVLADLDNINQKLAELNAEYNSIMSVDRNVGMLEVTKEYLESGKTVFCAVGLAHLLAENGLVNTLREAGYTVELVTYN